MTTNNELPTLPTAHTKQHPLSQQYSDNALEIIDSIIRLTRADMYIDDEFRQPYETEEALKEIRIASFRPRISSDNKPIIEPIIKFYMEELGFSYVPYLDTTLEFSLYLERSTVFYHRSLSAAGTYTEIREPFAQLVVLDVLKKPDLSAVPHHLKQLNEMQYKNRFTTHPYYEKLKTYYEELGILYMVEYDPTKVVDNVMKLIKNKKDITDRKKGIFRAGIN